MKNIPRVEDFVTFVLSEASMSGCNSLGYYFLKYTVYFCK